MKIAVFEDELLTRGLLIRTIRKLRPDWEITFEGESVEEAVEFLQADPDIDLIFMDVELSDGNCFDALRLSATSKPVIFTTAYEHFAMQAFKTEVIDYIIKPVSESDLLFAINKFESRTRTAPDAPTESAEQTQEISRLLCVAGDQYIALPLEKVLWIESDSKYAFAVDVQGRSRMLQEGNLSRLVEMLPVRDFFRLSRTIIVSYQAIQKVSKHFKGRLAVDFGNDKCRRQETVSASRRSDFLAWLGR